MHDCKIVDWDVHVKHQDTCCIHFRPNKKISVFWVTALKILGRVGTYKFLVVFFLEKKYDFMHLERHFAFQNA